MKNITIRRYQSTDSSHWNTFIAHAKNATFLFHRDFMEYHSDRFEDYSLMAEKEGTLLALFPANRVGETLFSHQGLTYGGFLLSDKCKAADTEELVQVLVAFAKKNAFKNIVLKLVPSIYNRLSTNDLDYFILQNGGVLSRRDMNLAIDMKHAFTISKSKLKHFRRISASGIHYVEESDFSFFWTKVLVPRLQEKHQTKPVHSLEEIHYLASKFPRNIKQFSVYDGSEILAGITIFETNRVVKSQYGATTQKGEKLRALDFLFIHLIEKYKKEGKSFFDMGVVNENEGKSYNAGLLNQKEELGCSVYNHDFYTLAL